MVKFTAAATAASASPRASRAKGARCTGLLLLPLMLGACGQLDEYRKPIALTPHGDAVRANMTAQIINPLPPARRPILTDAARTGQGLAAYRKGEVKEPTDSATAARTSDVQ